MLLGGGASFEKSKKKLADAQLLFKFEKSFSVDDNHTQTDHWHWGPLDSKNGREI